MSYNQDDDKLLKEFSEEGINIKIGIYSYKGSTPKVQITRAPVDNKFFKLGRLNKEEINFIKCNLDEVLEYLE